MRRSWILAFLFLTLWQMLPHEGYNMLYAQDMGDESYGGGYNCEDDLGQYYSSLPCENTPCFEKCMICGGQFICDEFSGHSCEEKTHCPYCDNLLTQEEFLYHNCSTQDMGCLICGRPYEYCTCEGPVITPDTPPVIPSNPPVTPSNPPVAPNNPTVTPNKPSSEEEEDETLKSTEGNNTDSDGYHKCPCLISFTTQNLISSIDNNQMLNELNDNYWGLTEALKRQVAFPETIQQGNNGTCVAATLQKYLAENYPNDYIDCVTSLAETGRYEKWNLTIPEECCLDRIDTTDLEWENQGHAEYYQNGIDYTSVDMLIQTAIQNWRNEKLRQRGKKMPNYNPVTDDGDSFAVGMTLNYAKDFLQENVYGSFGGPLSVEETIPFVTSYNQLEYLTSQYSPDSYTFIASVAVEQQNNGTYSFTTSKLANHMVEITGTKDGYINCWTWGKNGTTSTRNDYIYELMVLKKTDAGKQLETAKQQLSCNCATCSNTGCDSCSDSLYYNW